MKPDWIPNLRECVCVDALTSVHITCTHNWSLWFQARNPVSQRFLWFFSSSCLSLFSNPLNGAGCGEQSHMKGIQDENYIPDLHTNIVVGVEVCWLVLHTRHCSSWLFCFSPIPTRLFLAQVPRLMLFWVRPGPGLWSQSLGSLSQEVEGNIWPFLSRYNISVEFTDIAI